MRLRAGQAVRFAGRRLHRLAQAALALLMLLLAVVIALAWRLDQGPLPLPWLAHRLEAAAHARGLDLRVGGASVAWAGFSRGLGQPLRVALTGLHVAGNDDATAPVRVLRLDAAFAIGPLLGGNLVPDGVTLDGLRLTLTRDPAGAIALGTQRDPGPALSAILHPRPAAGGRGGGPPLDWRDLHHLHGHDIAISLYDAQLGLPWQVTRADADLDRAADGTVSGRATAAVAAGGRRASLTLDARQRADGGGSELRAALTPLNPASLAGLAPDFAMLAALDAPVGLTARVELDPHFAWRRAHLDAQIGAGTVHAGTGSAPLLAATLAADATPATLDATQSLTTAPSPDGPRTVVGGAVHATRAAAGWRVTVDEQVDRVGFADLPALWPSGTGGPGSRPWIVGNITAGELTGGRLAMTLEIPADLSDARLTAIDGAIDGHDLTVHWLRPVPPIEHAEGRLTITDPDVIDIAMSAGRQARPAGAGGPADGIAFSQGRVHLTGIAGHDQFADIATDLAGSLPDLIAVLKNPKVKLLDKRPVPMRDPAGTFAAHLAITHLPLRDDVAMADLALATSGHFSGVHLGGIAAGRDLDHGELDLSADNDGLHATGVADLAGIPAHLAVGMDFRAGPPSQIVQTVTVRAALDTSQLAGLGMPVHGLLAGGIRAEATLRSRRDARDDIQAEADLTRTAISAGRFGYSKPAGQPVRASLHVSLDHDRLVSIEQVQVRGPGVDIEGAADFAHGQPQTLHLDRIRLASPDDPRATDAHGTVRLPLQAGGTYAVELSGASLDATGVFARTSPAVRPAPPATQAAGSPWTLDATLGRVILGPDRRVDQASAHVAHDGRVVREARLSGVAQSPAPRGARQRPAPFLLTIAPDGNGRRLQASAPDAGGLLRVLDVASDLSGGRMTVAARYDDTQPSHPLSGVAELHGFRILNAPMIGRILQAATLYGLIEVLRGPGLGFTTMVAPFRFDDDTLTLTGARAFSASLGFTAKGRADLGGRSVDMTGTIVPAYALNTLPGRIPLLGRLFSPERGGGLFAATYAVRGSFDDPKVVVNPLATLTPGFLRGLFGLFRDTNGGR